MPKNKHAGHTMPSLSGADKQQARALRITAWLTGIYFLIELAVGLYTGSIAVISDAFHTFSAVGGVVLAIIAARIARRPASLDKTFGWYRAEIVGALLNGAFLLVMAIVVIVMGIMRLNAPIELPTGIMLWVAAGGLVTEIISMYLLFKLQGENINVRGAYWHVLQTFVGSIIIIVAALVIRFTGFVQIDPILGTAFGFVLLWASWGIMRDALHLLMEGTPDDVDLEKVTEKLAAIEGVEDVHHVHAFSLTSGKHVFSSHLRLTDQASKRAADILKSAHHILKNDFGFFFSTVQTETQCLDEVDAETIEATHKKPDHPAHASTTSS